jgi:hypothetical protein
MFTRLPDRPWGRMWMLYQHPRLWVKLIHVRRGQRTSNQYHLERREFHYCLSRLSWNYVPKRRLHRMRQGLYLEIAWGRPDEDDIVRMSDDYGRH